MRVLVIQLKRIGDVILTTPLLAALRQQAPGCAMTMALDTTTAPLAAALDVDRTLVFRRGLAGWNFWREVAGSGFDVCLDLTGNDRSAAIAALSRARRKITWARLAGKPWRRAVFTDFVESSVRDRHTADHQTDLLRALDIEVENVPLHLRLPEVARSEARQALARAGVDGPFSIVHPGTARAEKYWLPERWSEVIEFLRAERGRPVILTGARDPAERAHLDAIQRGLAAPGIDFSGQLSLLATAALIEQASLLCAVDSAPVHFADALGTPLVALFGPTNPFHWRPRRATSRIVAATEPATATYVKAPMSELPVERVIAALRELG